VVKYRVNHRPEDFARIVELALDHECTCVAESPTSSVVTGGRNACDALLEVLNDERVVFVRTPGDFYDAAGTMLYEVAKLDELGRVTKRDRVTCTLRDIMNGSAADVALAVRADHLRPGEWFADETLRLQVRRID
jgi:hypothetical protein